MRVQALLRALLVSIVLCFVLGWGRRASAYPWMIKHGLAHCGACHTDPSGGETLTGMGRAQSQRLLSAGGDDAVEPSAYAGVAFGAFEEPPGLRLGGSYRHMLIYEAASDGAPSDTSHFPMQLDLYGSYDLGPLVASASFGLARGIEGSAHVRSAQLNRENGDGLILLSRNHYVGLWLQEHTLLRVGRLNLPFGLRIPEHVAWVRESTRTDRESDQQHGALLSYARGRMRTEVMLVFGNFQLNPDQFRERGLVGSFEYLLTPTAALGASMLFTRSEVDRLTLVEDAIRMVYGLNGRMGLGREMSLLAELDVVADPDRNAGYTGFVQADYEPLRGLHLMLTGEVLDQGLLESPDAVAVRGAGKPRFGTWLSANWFFATHFEIRFDVVMRQEDALNAQAQFHVYF